MQIDKSAQDGVAHCWLNPDEFDALVDAAATMSLRHKVVVQLGGRCSLRSFEVPQITPNCIKQAEDGNHYLLHVPRGKDTSGEGGKPRDAYLPADLERDLLELKFSMNIDDDEPYFDVGRRRIQQMVKEAAREAARRAEQGDAPGSPSEWRLVSSHDMRRYYAHNLLVRERVNPRVVMDAGGWDSMANLKPYLNKPTESEKVDELAGVA